MVAWYNEIDPFCAAWLRNLIAEGLIAPGDVDERDIRDVRPDEIRGYTQCHFFAGIGVWSYALRLAGWSDDRPVWTGSCPCQPFSAAGRHGGVADERHLWPHWNHLVGERRPAVVFGEQVASKAGLEWFDLVSADLEGAGYAVGAADMCAAGCGAPHIRQRLWFVAEGVADASGEHLWRGFGAGDGPPGEAEGEARQRERRRHDARFGSTDERLAHPDDTGPQGRGERRDGADQRAAGAAGVVGRLADAGVGGGIGQDAPEQGRDGPEDRLPVGDGRDGVEYGSARPTDGFWRDADWLLCRDGKWRPVEPGTFPLAHGAPARVGRLRAYGNAIVAEVAAEFVRAYLGREAVKPEPTLLDLMTA